MRWCFRDSPRENHDILCDVLRCFLREWELITVITLILITNNHRNESCWPKCNCISLWFKDIDVTLGNWAKFLISKTWNAVSASCGMTQSLADSIWWFQQEKTRRIVYQQPWWTQERIYMCTCQYRQSMATKEPVDDSQCRNGHEHRNLTINNK